MILIVESGSSKADWLVVDSSGVVLSFETKGWNILFLSIPEIQFRLSCLTNLETYLCKIDKVYFYAPGSFISDSVENLKTQLKAKFTNADVYIESDLLAACRSVFKGKPLFVSILGTGSNTAFFDGDLMAQNTPSLGFILGDEGSGASLGKELLREYLYQRLPKDLYIRFSMSYSISKEMILKSVYTQDSPSKFLASYVPFLAENRTHKFIHELVVNQLELYLKTHLLNIPNIHDYKLSFVGGVAYAFPDLLISLCAKHNITIGEILKRPKDGLVSYHLLNS